MVLDEANKRWACLSCIKGHRAAKCSHADRWLIKVRQSGRPRTRTTACDHPDKNECDCAGIRKCLMVAIPNNQACQCSGDHTCFRGTQLYITRVENQDDVPAVAPEILQHRAELSEKFRVGGPESVTKVYPDYYTGKQKPAESHGSALQQIKPAATVNTHSSTPQQLPVPTRNEEALDEAPRSCCQPQPPPAQASAKIGPTSPVHPIKAESISIQSSPQFHGAANPFHFGGQSLYDDGLTPSIGSSNVPWTEPRHREMISPNKLVEQYTCTCGSTCACLGCHAHPYNSRMRQTVGSILTGPSHRGSVEYGPGPQSPGAPFPAFSNMSQPKHTPSTPATLPPTVDSSQYTHYEYQYDDLHELDGPLSPDQYGIDYEVSSPQAFDHITSPILPPSNMSLQHHADPDPPDSSTTLLPIPFAFPAPQVGVAPPYDQSGHYPVPPHHNMPSSPPYYQQTWAHSAPQHSSQVYGQPDR